jgi:hypothetical protein
LHKDFFRVQTMTALMKSFCGGVQMLHGGSFFKKRPPWPPEAEKCFHFGQVFKIFDFFIGSQ